MHCQAVCAQGAVTALAAVAGASTDNKRVSAQNVGVKSSSYNGTAMVESVAAARSSESKSKSKSKKASRRSNQVRANLRDAFSNPLGTLVNNPLNPLKGLVNKASEDETIEIKGKLVLSRKSILDLINLGTTIFDDQFDVLFNQLVALQLVSVDHAEGKPNEPKLSKKSQIEKWFTSTGLEEKIVAGDESYAVTFHVPADFGEIGAFVIRNNHPNEFYLHNLTLELPNGVTYEFPCNSWVYNDNIYSTDRVFFSNKTYLPGQTPAGLKKYREQELNLLRGKGKGIRLVSDRIYDYDVYNDLGNPDLLMKRPPLGGSKGLPYPRRCRTGRLRSLADTNSESNIPVNSLTFYIPVDESFTRDKNSGFLAGALKGVAHAIVPVVTSLFDSSPDKWDSIDEILDLYSKGLPLGQNLSDTDDKEEKSQLVFLDTIFQADGDDKSVLRYPKPELLKVEENAWMNDEEYGRQTLAGINPVVIQAVKKFPPTSSLDPKEWGPATALTNADIEPFLEGLSVQEAIKQKKLFIIDYRDLIMPYIERINQTNSKAYAPRSYFFYTSKGTMRPVAIELSLPPTKSESASNRVFTPSLRSEDKKYLWELAKVHASAIDFGFHEVYSHWLRTHAVMEPFIIATHRHLSKLHPVHTLLLPLYKNTMMINSAARQALINSNGIIELTFSPGRYSMEFSSKVYGALWRFDHQAFPRDLIARGMAEPADASQPGGVKLVVDDYPFAKDGLELWDAIYSYMGKYLNIVYDGSDKAVQDDVELQAWWKEAVEVGHGDKKNEPWWPKADSIKSLTDICATIAWIAGPHHAAVNFGQYAYAGFMPNKPSQCKRLIPEKGSKEEEEMLQDPEKWLMNTISSQIATAIVMTTIELLSTHAVDEEYQGKRLHNNWTSDPEIKAAFAEFSAKMEDLQRRFEERNGDASMLNRAAGPAKLPYTLLYPESETSGLTGCGVPYSVSI